MSGNPPTVPDRNEASTNGWDTVFAINFTNANTALTSDWANVNSDIKNITATYTDPDFGVVFTLTGVFSPWQLTTGGDGKNIRMTCPFLSGTYTAGTKSYDLASTGSGPVEITIEVGMEWVPDPSQQCFVLSNAADNVPTITSDLGNNLIDDDLKSAFNKNNLPLTANAVTQIITQGRVWHITDGNDTTNGYYLFCTQDKDGNQFLTVYKYQTSWINNLKLLEQDASMSNPAVNVVSIANNPAPAGIAGDGLNSLLSGWFNTNIGQFNHVFAVLDLVPSISTDDAYAWTKPTSTSYAVTDMGSMDTSIFGVLTMSQGNPVGLNHQVSQYAIPTDVDANGANAGFLISGPDFVKYMLLPGAQAIFNGADLSKFEIINDQLTVQNTDTLVWGKFMMDNNKLGEIADNNYSSSLDQGQLPQGLVLDMQNMQVFLPGGITVQVTDQGTQWLLTTGQTNADEYILDKDGNNLDVYLATIVTIDKGGFKMSLNQSFVQIDFIALNYAYSSDYNVSVNYTEQVVLGLQDQSGKKIFWFDQVLRNLAITVSKTKSAITREIVESAVSGVLALLAVAGPILEGLGSAAEIGAVTEDGGTAAVDAEAFADVENANPGAAEEDAEDAASNGASQLDNKLTNIKNAFATPKWKCMAAIAGVAGAIKGLDSTLSAIAEAAAKNEWENVPGFDIFANAVIAPYTFPAVAGFDITSAWLAGSLQIGLATKSS